MAVGPREHEVVRSPLTDAQEASEPEAERRLELAQELVVRQREHPLDLGGLARPDHAAATVGERQDRDRAFFGEALVGDVVVEALRGHDGRDCNLLVADVIGFDACLVADQRANPVGGHDQPGAERARLTRHFVMHDTARVCQFAARHPGWRDHLDRGRP